MSRKKKNKKKTEAVIDNSDMRNGVKLPEREWNPSLICGCGMCRYKRPILDTCPKHRSEGAITLWTSRPR